MASVYILYSVKCDKFYIGSCKDTIERLNQHLTKEFSGAFTTRATDWEIYYYIDNLEYEQARKIESHIKRMKSRKFLADLKKYPEIMQRLTYQYQ